MMIKAKIAKLLDKEMDRRSFLIHIAAGAVALVGASAALRLFSGDTKNLASQRQSRGYGGAPYGR